MAYTIASGPPCSNAVHAWVPLLGDEPPTIGDQGDVWPPALPYVKLLGVDGWLNHPESIDQREGSTSGDGEQEYPLRILGKTLVYRYEIRATSEEEEADLTIAFGNGFYKQPGTMTVTPYEYIGGPVWTFSGRVTSHDPDPSFSYFPRRRAPFRRKLSTTLRLSDPYFYTEGGRYPALP